jgi:NAD(P)-dependent dehydrogenase (short-subunit alcohol dehydrogenase family)
VLISSGLAGRSMPSSSSVYGAAKGGLHGPVRNLAWELGPAGIYNTSGEIVHEGQAVG